MVNLSLWRVLFTMNATTSATLERVCSRWDSQYAFSSVSSHSHDILRQYYGSSQGSSQSLIVNHAMLAHGLYAIVLRQLLSPWARYTPAAKLQETWYSIAIVKSSFISGASFTALNMRPSCMWGDLYRSVVCADAQKNNSRTTRIHALPWH